MICCYCKKDKNPTEFSDGKKTCGACLDGRKVYSAKHRKKIIARVTKWAKDNKEKRKAYLAAYYLKNKEKHLATSKKWKRDNIEKNRAYGRKTARKMSLIPKNRISDAISAGMYRGVKKNRGGNSWESLVGYTLFDLINHLSKQFQAGMTFENYGEWHIDHKIPISKFNFSDVTHDDFKRCWALDNLQPLWAAENIKKHNKLGKPFQPRLELSV